MVDALEWENVMFSGITGILKHYEKYLFSKSLPYVDNSRATLNHDDLMQCGRNAIVRCWNKHNAAEPGTYKNFDMLVKWAVENSFRTEVGREFTLKRGRHHLCFLSEVISEEQKNSVDGFENVCHRYNNDSICLSGNRSGIDNLISAVVDYLPDKHLKDTFSYMVDHDSTENFECMHPKTIPVKRRRMFAEELGVGEEELGNRLESIHFILNGFRSHFIQETWR